MKPCCKQTLVELEKIIHKLYYSEDRYTKGCNCIELFVKKIKKFEVKK